VLVEYRLEYCLIANNGVVTPVDILTSQPVSILTGVLASQLTGISVRILTTISAGILTGGKQTAGPPVSGLT